MPTGTIAISTASLRIWANCGESAAMMACPGLAAGAASEFCALFALLASVQPVSVNASHAVAAADRIRFRIGIGRMMVLSFRLLGPAHGGTRYRVDQI